MSDRGRREGRPSRILLVEDEPDILNLLRYHFLERGFSTQTAADGAQALELLRREPPDLVILDLMLPDMNGLSLCKRIRHDPEHWGIPVLMLTALGQEEDRITGFEIGADDYVVKPFSPRELLLRVESLLSRTYGRTAEAAGNAVYELGGMRVELEAYRVLIHGEDVGVTTTEFLLLQDLLRANGRVLSREQLLEQVWGYEFAGYDRTVDTHLHRLRHKLGPYAACIQTVRGIGYRFNPRMDSHGEL
ncbi:MAG: response regulator transcription factor [Desulfohalobiaceae bacterium]|nr:response regulator transcription factor [Desulfohalobiaceae bacterium]